MVINTTWTNPTTAVSSSGLDFATGNTIDEATLDRLVSNIYRLGGADGNSKTGALFIEDTTGNTFMGMGITINQGASDNEILAYKSSDVAHGITLNSETDTYGSDKKQHATNGGRALQGFSAGTTAIELFGIHTTDNVTKAVGGIGATNVDVYLKSGTSGTSLGANANLISFRNAGTTRFILDGDGDSHQDVGTAWTNFDAHDDAALLNALAHEVARPGDPIKDDFRSWLTYNRADLERARLVTFNPDGHHFVNMSRLTMVLVGAARQQAARLAALETRLLAA